MYILNNEAFYPYFRDCIDALDGTYILTFIPEHKHAPYCNHKGEISQNMLVVCFFNLKFIYILSGWEGSASDSTVY
jgi:hypothetical protein